jgi:chromosome segregation ATPase
MNPDTPRTDAARERYYDGKTSDWVHYTICRMIEQELAASKAEAAKLNHQLLKTESDLLQSQDINSFLDTEFRIACKQAEKAEAQSESRRQSLAFALNEIKKVEAEVERLNNILENTRMSRDTMIEDRNLLDQELAASKAEVARLQKELDATCNAEELRQERETRKKAEAEIERLKGLLSDLLILTEKNYWNSRDYNQIKEAINPTDK